MTSYKEFKEKTTRKMNELPIKYAFTNAAFEEAMKELGVELENIKKDVYSVGHGGYMRKSDVQQYLDCMDARDAEFTELIKDEAFCFDMFVYELNNYEYVITYDIQDTLDALGLSKEQIDASPVLNISLNKAVARVLEDY